MAEQWKRKRRRKIKRKDNAETIAIAMVLLSPMRFAFPQAHAADSSTAGTLTRYLEMRLRCNEVAFTPAAKQKTIRYELGRINGVWKIEAPEPDSAYVDWRTLDKSLQQSETDEHWTAENRKQAETAREALSRAAGAKIADKVP